MREAINFIWKLSVLAKLAVSGRLLLEGLAGEYPALLTACCILPIKSLLLMYSFANAHLRVEGRQAAEYLAPIEWIVSAWVVFELFSRWTQSYTGIGRFGKLLLATLLAAALLISIAFWHVEWQALVFARNFRIFYLLHRIVFGALAIFVVGTWLFFRNYPVAIAPNVVRHTYIAAVYFSVGALSFLTFTLNGLKMVESMNLVIVTTGVACFTAWAVLLTRKGQIPPPVQRVSAEDRARIERLNDELLVFMGNVPKDTR